jgi:hypothetical protein
MNETIGWPREGTISYYCYLILPEAIDLASSGGKYKFTARTLFYKARELCLKRFGVFYSGKTEKIVYSSFTQDFLTMYERKIGKIDLMVREPRGFYVSPGLDKDEDMVLTDYIKVGHGNKIIVVEKAGIYEVMKQNKFHKRLDATIVCTKGFTTEAGRQALINICEESPEIPILILHDYDVNGILIEETLKRPTKRRDIYVPAERIIDLGLNWEVVKKFGLDKYPEPVKLKKQDLGKLEGMFRRGEISEEEYGFLKQYRVELNALTPEQLLSWLEETLKEMGLGKTIPTQEELEEEFEKKYEKKLRYVVSDVLIGIEVEIEREIGFLPIVSLIREIEEEMRKLSGPVVEKIAKTIQVEKPTIEDIKKELQIREEEHWTDIVDYLAWKKSSEIKPTLKQLSNQKIPEIIPQIKSSEKIQQLIYKLKQHIQQFSL